MQQSLSYVVFFCLGMIARSIMVWLLEPKYQKCRAGCGRHVYPTFSPNETSAALFCSPCLRGFTAQARDGANQQTSSEYTARERNDPTEIRFSQQPTSEGIGRIVYPVGCDVFTWPGRKPSTEMNPSQQPCFRKDGCATDLECSRLIACPFEPKIESGI